MQLRAGRAGLPITSSARVATGAPALFPVWVCLFAGCLSGPLGRPRALGPTAGESWAVPGLEMELAWVQPLGGWVGRYEVTNQQFRRFRPEHCSDQIDDHSLDGAHQPAVNVTQGDAAAFASWLTERERQRGRLPLSLAYRLPDDGEWTAFAQCGDERTYPWGDEAGPPKDWNLLGQEARELSLWPPVPGHVDPFAVSCPVAESGVNSWGLSGVGDNVSEWTGEEADGKVVWRGGCWYYYRPGCLKCVYRHETDRETRLLTIGFRLVLARVRRPSSADPGVSPSP